MLRIALQTCVTCAIIMIVACNSTPKHNKELVDTNKETNPTKIVDSTKQQIYLTFDDGPTVGSLRLYQYLLKNEIPVTLYLVGKHYEAMPGLKKMLDSLRQKPYIVFANHSFSHGYNDRYVKFYNDIPGVINDYTTAQQVLGITSNIARCAGRNVWRTPSYNANDSIAEKGPVGAMDSLYARGYNFTGWDIVWSYNYKTFKNTRDVNNVLQRTQKSLDSSYSRIKNHVVILGHDQQYADDEDFKQLTNFIDSLKANPKYQLATMDMYPSIRKK